MSLNGGIFNGAAYNGAFQAPAHVKFDFQEVAALPLVTQMDEVFSYQYQIAAKATEKYWMPLRVVADLSREAYTVRLSKPAVEEYDLRAVVVGTSSEFSRILRRIHNASKESYWAGVPIFREDAEGFNYLAASTHQESYTIFSRVFIDQVARYAVWGALSVDAIEVFSLNKTVKTDMREGYTLGLFNRVSRTVREIYSGYEETSEYQQHVIQVSNQDGPLNAEAVQIQCDEASHSFQAVIELSDTRSWMQCQTNDVLTIVINDMTFTVILDDRVRTKEYGQTKYVINARSVASRMGVPYATPITKDYGATTARTVAQELCDLHGVTLVWNIVDWPLPDSRLSIANEPPLSIIMRLAQAAGGTIISGFDGELIVQYDYPVPLGKYATEPVELVLTEIDDIFSLTDTREYSAGVNSVVVSDQNLGVAGYIGIMEDTEAADGFTKYLNVFTYPVEDRVLRTSKSEVSLVNLGWITDEVTELVEIINGVGNIEYPATSLILTTYKDTNLGTMVSDGMTLTTETTGFTLAEVTYQRTYQRYKVISSSTEKAQIYTS